MCAVLALYLLVQLNNIYNRAFIGQDFRAHAWCTDQAILEPSRWFHLDSTNRPLLYWVGAACKQFTHARYTYELSSIVFVVLSAVALNLLHASTKLFITSPLIRLAGLVFIAFLPVTLITSVVYAADTAALLPFALLVYAVCRLSGETSPAQTTLFSAIAAAALCMGILAKATFALLPAGTAFLCYVFWRVRLFSWRKAAIIGFIASALPLVFAGLLQLRVNRELAGQPVRHAFNWHGTGEMTWRSLLLVRFSDARIFRAPAYWDEEVNDEGKKVPPMTVDNGYSYLPLLVLGIFTDVLDYANLGELDKGTPRPEDHQQLATIAVGMGAGVTLLMLGSLVVGVTNLFFALWTGRTDRRSVLIWVILALNWAVPLVITLPFIQNVYAWGYWLPRLILPAVWSTAILLFILLDSWLATQAAKVRALTAGLIACEAIVHIASVWY